MFDKDEFSNIRRRFDVLNKTLNDYKNAKAKMESMFSKKYTPKKHVSDLHAHKAHTDHAFMYNKVYTCTHCGRKGYLTRFCYDKQNIINNTNPQELKKI